MVILMIFTQFEDIIKKEQFKIKTFLIENLTNLALSPPSLTLKLNMEKIK